MRAPLFLLIVTAFNCTAQKISMPPPLETPHYYEKFVQGKQAPVLKGLIRNVPDSVKRSTKYLKVKLYSLSREDDYTKEIKISPGGSFEVKLDYALPMQQVALEVYDLADRRIYLSRNLFVDIDYQKLEQNKTEALNYRGVDAALNYYADKFARERNNYNYKTQVFEKLNHLDEVSTNMNEFRQNQMKLNTAVDTFVNSFVKRNDLAHKYSWLIYNNIMSDRYGKLLYFYSLTEVAPYDDDIARVNGFKPRVINPEVTGFYYSLNKCAPLLRLARNEELKMTSLLDTLLADRLTQEADKGKIKGLKALLCSFFAHERNGTGLQSLDDSLNKPLSEINAKYADFFKAYFSRFAQRVNRQTYYNYLESTYGNERADILFSYNEPSQLQVGLDSFNVSYKRVIPQFKTRLVRTYAIAYVNRITKMPLNLAVLKAAVNTKGTNEWHYTYNKTILPHNLNLYENDKIDGATILKQLSQTHKDKLILIDMWGTWCPGCLDQFPKSAILHTKVDTSKVEFVYLCNISGKKDCMVDVVKFNLKGTNIFLNASQTRQLAALFNLKGYPTYVLINKKGDIDLSAAHLVDDPEAGAKELNTLAQ